MTTTADRQHAEPVLDLGAEAGARRTLSVLAASLGLSAAGLLPLLPWLTQLDPYHAWFASAHVTLCAFGVALSLADGLRPCLLVASVFPYCWLVVPSVYQVSHQQAAWADNTVTVAFSSTLRAQAVLLLGQLALVLAHAVASRQGAARSVWTVDDGGRVRMVTLSLLFGAGALAMIPWVASAAGGIDSFFTSRNDFNAALQAGGVQVDDRATRALLKTVPSALATSSVVLALWLVRTSERRTPARRLAIGVTILMVPALFIVANPFVYSRYLVLAAFGTVALALFRPRSRQAGVACLVAALMAFLLAYPAADAFRREGSTASTGPMLASKDYDGFQQAINAVSYVDRHGTTNGQHLVSGALFFVPRKIWTEKAVPAAFPVAEDRGYRFTNLSLPLPAEAYLDLGWAGVVLVLGLVGVVFARLDRAWLDQSRLAVVAAYLAVAQVGLWRGPFGSLSSVFGFTVGLLLLGILVSSKRGDRHEPASIAVTARVRSAEASS